MLKTLGKLGLIVLLAAIHPALSGANSFSTREMTAPAKGTPQSRNAPDFSFSKLPTQIMTSYYDYMIGGFNNLPLQVIPQSENGGYFLTYHARQQPTSNRRAFYSYIDAQGNIINNNELSEVDVQEGYSDVAVDPVSGKPMYVWHANADADSDLEVIFTSDAFISGIAGLWNYYDIVMDNPISITAPNGSTTTDNQFIWPSITIGPSPLANKRRVYVLARNATSHGANNAGNIYLAHADFSTDDIEMGTPMAWSYTSVPELNAWAVDAAVTRRPSGSLVSDGMGNIYYAGYHSSSISESDLDIFKCNNFGAGTWTRLTENSTLPSWNPPSGPDDPWGYFEDEGGSPYADLDLNWKIRNSGHLNATIDNFDRIHIPGLWALTADQDIFFPSLQFVKDVLYRISTNEFTIQDIYPQIDPSDTFNSCFTPWDIEAPWGEVDEWGFSPEYGSYPVMETDWPFPHWDDTAHNNAMMFHYNNVKITQATQQGVMAAVWQDSQRSMDNNEGSADILIAISPNCGEIWLEPIVLNNIDTPQLAGMRPMWVYPADKMIYTGIQNGWQTAKLGLMFYDDYTWGANALSPSYHPTNSGGRVMFTELMINYWYVGVETVFDPVITPWGGTFTEPVYVSLQTQTNGAQIRYTLDGSIPGYSSLIYSSPILIEENTILNAFAHKPGYEDSGYVSAQFTFQVAAPVFSLEGGTYTQPIEVALTCPTPDAQIRYTLDGSEPSADSELYTQPFILPLDSGMYIRARAFRNGWNSSASVVEGYSVTGSLSAPGFLPAGGTFYLPITVYIFSDDDHAQIRYTTDGSEPTEDSALYQAPFILEHTTTVKAKAYQADWISSPTSEMVFSFPEYTTALRKTYPNPFSGNLKIELGIKEAGQSYKLAIYNIKGECVFSYEGQEQGVFTYQWDGRDRKGKRLSAGLYLLRFTAGDSVQTRKIMMLGAGSK